MLSVTDRHQGHRYWTNSVVGLHHMEKNSHLFFCQISLSIRAFLPDILMSIYEFDYLYSPPFSQFAVLRTTFSTDIYYCTQTWQTQTWGEISTIYWNIDISRYCFFLQYWYCACSYHDNDTITIILCSLNPFWAGTRLGVSGIMLCFNCWKIADLQAHIAPPSGAIWAL